MTNISYGVGASRLQPALKIIQKIFIYSILNKITTMKNLKYIKLFEEWSPNLGYNESEKEQLKKAYEEYVMSKDYIPNMIRDLLKTHIKTSRFTNFKPENPHAIEISWEPVTFAELKRENNIPNKKKEFYDVCFAGTLTLNVPFARHYDTTAGGGFNDQRGIFGERFDMILAQATKKLPLSLAVDNEPDYWIKNPEVYDTSHGPNTFIELDNTYTRGEEHDEPGRVSTRYMARFALCLDKVYLEI